MKRKYFTKTGETLAKVGRFKKIYFSANSCFFNWHGIRYHLDEIPSLSYPVFYVDNEGKLGVISGYITISNCFGVYVEIDPNGEAAQLWEVIED